MSERTEKLKEVILELMPSERANAMGMSKLASRLGIDTYQLKQLIFQLRLDYPICSQTKNGGGYWMSSSEKEISEFITMIAHRRNSYNKTIAMMTEHLES